MQQNRDDDAGGVNELTRPGALARSRSAPSTWIDALLQDDDSLKLSGPHQQGGLTQLLTAATLPSPGPSGRSSSPFVDPGFFDEGGSSDGRPHGNAEFQRMNSSPAEFFAETVDGYFSSFGIPSSYDYGGSSSVDVSPTGKRLRDAGDPLWRGEEGEQLSSARQMLDMDIDKLLEDSVPCRVRAKRGFATHPRSIAERVRRTKISDRIRKLQELVPNMDKQTNTADMLEEAVEYVKNLQKQIEELTEQHKRCKCMGVKN